MKISLSTDIMLRTYWILKILQKLCKRLLLSLMTFAMGHIQAAGLAPWQPVVEAWDSPVGFSKQVT